MIGFVLGAQARTRLRTVPATGHTRAQVAPMQIAFENGARRAEQILGGDLLDESRNIDVRGAGVRARRVISKRGSGWPRPSLPVRSAAEAVQRVPLSRHSIMLCDRSGWLLHRSAHQLHIHDAGDRETRQTKRNHKASAAQGRPAPASATTTPAARLNQRARIQAARYSYSPPRR